MKPEVEFKLTRQFNENITDALKQHLGLAIVVGEYGCQGKIPSEADLCKQYGVSRVVVREAVKMLGAKKMVFSRMSQGTWIAPENEWDLFDRDVLSWIIQRKSSQVLLKEFNEIRMAVEPAGVRLAAIRGNVDSMRLIEICLNGLITACLNDCSPLEAKTQFHLCILNASGNRLYINFSPLIKTAIEYQNLIGPAHMQGASFESVPYEKLYEHISNGDELAAVESMKSILTIAGIN